MPLDLATFFAKARGPKHAPGLLGPTLDQGEVDGCEAVINAFEGCPTSWVAYALATTYHETAGTMRPIRERGSNSYLTRNYDVTGRDPERARRYGNTQPGDGAKYCGRGFVQLTWKSNYAWASSEVGVDLVAQPDLAMRPDIAAAVLRKGVELGRFNGHGHGLGYYLPHDQGQTNQFIAARRTVNITDKARLIAGYAQQFQSALNLAGYSAR